LSNEQKIKSSYFTNLLSSVGVNHELKENVNVYKGRAIEFYSAMKSPSLYIFEKLNIDIGPSVRLNEKKFSIFFFTVLYDKVITTLYIGGNSANVVNIGEDWTTKSFYRK
jgi:hypothetical protein